MLTKSAEEAVAQAYGIIPELTLGGLSFALRSRIPPLTMASLSKLWVAPIFPEKGEVAGADAICLLADHSVSVSAYGNIHSGEPLIH